MLQLKKTVGKLALGFTQTVLFFFVAQRDLANSVCNCKDGGCIWCFSSVPKTLPGFEQEEDRRRREWRRRTKGGSWRRK